MRNFLAPCGVYLNGTMGLKMKCCFRMTALIPLVGAIWTAHAPVCSAKETKTSPVTTQSETSAQKNSELLEKAEHLRKTERYADIVKLLKPKTAKLTHDELIVLARAYTQTHDHLAALRTLELALALNGKDPATKTELGQTYARLGRSDEAIAQFREARQIDAKYQPAYEALLNEYTRIGERYEARIVIGDMIKLFGDRASYHTMLCRLYALDNFLEKSVEECRLAIEQEPSVPENYVHLATSLNDLSKEAEAENVFLRAATKFKDSEYAQRKAGEFQMQKKNFILAHKFFRAAVVLDRKSAPALHGYANASFELQQTEEALQAYIRACASDKAVLKDFRAAYARLRLRQQTALQSRFEKAIADCE